ncbi:MAG: class I SAM-dependent methyltransferase [bacterium]|nr:class I SAM-dependent methyltransferase [bacterium]
MNQNDFDTFFESYSQNVDNANTLNFWKLSDALIFATIHKYIPTDLTNKMTILDAGGGTGRWICDLSKVYKSNFILFDLSEDMLEVSRKNIEKSGIEDRVRIVQGDLTSMSEIPSDSVDYIVSIYSPISFVYQKEKALAELYRIIKKGGIILMMGHGYYNAIASKINNHLASQVELHALDTEYKVKWGNHVPLLNVFSRESMEKLLVDARFSIIATHGIPVFVQPGPEDWDASNNKKSRISGALQDDEFYKEVFNLEMKYNSIPEVANRGMNIFTVAQK